MMICYCWYFQDGLIISIDIVRDHLLNRRKCIVTNKENSINIEHHSFSEHTGDAAKEGRFKYFLGVMIIGRI